MSEDEIEYSLVMPFVVCISQGGVYQDAAFVAGVRFGEIEVESKTIGNGHKKTWTVEPALVPQLDLLAMQRGCYIKVEPYSDDWCFVTFSR